VSDITRSLQHKQAALAKGRKDDALLHSLTTPEKETPRSPPTSPNKLKSPRAPKAPTPRARGADAPPLDAVDVLAEPHATLPLWRRVDRQFWWNEWMAKPFVDAGVRPFTPYVRALG
jgi:hypothetical protein